MPKIAEGNHDIWRVITICSNQWRMGFSGPTGLDFGTAFEVAKALRIKVDAVFLEKLKIFEATALQQMSQEMKKEK